MSTTEFLQGSTGMSCCCSCCNGGKCVHCTCIRAGGCVPLVYQQRGVFVRIYCHQLLALLPPPLMLGMLILWRVYHWGLLLMQDFGELLVFLCYSLMDCPIMTRDAYNGHILCTLRNVCTTSLVALLDDILLIC